uniref:Uncharacterized protein n=1 Tax=Callorhinchus milii TaxID=7868 RepID=A0A4W3KD76_CALMI
MESVLQRLAEAGGSGWRKPHRALEEEGGESPGWGDAGSKLRELPSCGSLHAARMSLRKRLPLKQVLCNTDQTPSWERLEMVGKKSSTMQTLSRTARNTLGNMSLVRRACVCVCVGWGGGLRRFSSPVTLCARRQFERDLDSVAHGIGQLKRLSHVFDEAIAKEERYVHLRPDCAPRAIPPTTMVIVGWVLFKHLLYQSTLQDVAQTG